MSELAAVFARESMAFLREAYLPRLRRALEVLPDGDLWWRPHEGAISFGTILKHLEGNARQWVVSGLGGAPDHRRRASEFTGAADAEGAELLARLERAVLEACAVVEGLREEELLATHSIQGGEVTALYAIYHVVEHFAWHAGQATWIAKARAGADHGLAFYDEARINSARNG